MASHNETGVKGEVIAKEFLKRNGYEILEKNWRSGKAEIDLIARRDGVLIFIEVKTRTNTRFGLPEDFVDNKKIKFLTSAAGDYMRMIEHDWEVRFDIVSVIIEDKKQPIVKHIEDAFFMGLQ